MDADVETDGGCELSADHETLYPVIRRAVRDALNEVVGTLILAIVAISLIWAGAATVLASPSMVGLVFGAGLSVLGLVIAGVAVGRVPKYGVCPPLTVGSHTAEQVGNSPGGNERG